ncbi:MAG: FG-GAP-like repeat-containing protein [archaeon]
MKRSTAIFFVILFQFIASETFSQDSLYYVTSFQGSSFADALAKTSGLGDVNGDGLDDFIIIYRSHTELYYGSRNLKAVKPAHVFRCYNSMNAGDVNGDGFADLITAEHDTADPYYPYTSDIFRIYFGGKDLDTVPKFFFKFPYYFNMLFTLGENIGDINGDGYGDFMIASPYNWDNGKGFIYAFSGGRTLSDTPILKLTCPDDSLAPHSFGRQMTGIGDYNNDGFDDFLVSMPDNERERVYLYYGGNPLNDKPAQILTDPVYKTGSYFGTDIRNAGDLNKDGQKEFIIVGGPNVYLYLSKDSIVTINCSNFHSLGLGTGGDINGDGFDDFLIGDANYLNNQEVMVGKIHGYFGSSIIDTAEDFGMIGTDKWFRYSDYSSIIGDINGDGCDEVFVHEPNWPDYNDRNSKGKATLYSYRKLTDAVDEKNSNPEAFSLQQNYPNPFNPSTTVSYNMPYSGHVELKVYDMLGKEVMNVFNGEKPAGIHKTNINAGSLPSGIYVCRIHMLSEKMSFLKSIKMTLLK